MNEYKENNIAIIAASNYNYMLVNGTHYVYIPTNTASKLAELLKIEIKKINIPIDTIKNCPFCGEQPFIHTKPSEDNKHLIHAIYCERNDCKVWRNSTEYYTDLNEAIKAWNKRVQHPKETTLRNCPYCGNKLTPYKTITGYRVYCANPKCTVHPQADHVSESAVIKIWNRRKYEKNQN